MTTRMSEMEVPSSPKAKDVLVLPEELELEDVWSDLHALRKLYVLLQKSSAKIPHGENQDDLDEKSRLLLKNLLDDATQRALQSQAKIVSRTPDPTASKAQSNEGTKSSPSREIIRKETQLPDDHQKCHEYDKIEARGPLVEAKPSPVPQSKQLGMPARAEALIEPKPCPNRAEEDWRLGSEKSSASPDARARRRRQIHQERDRVSIRMGGTPEPESRGMPRQSHSPQSGAIPTPTGMTQKRSRVETADRRSNAESTRIRGSPHGSPRSTLGPQDGRPTKTCPSDRTARIHRPEKRKEASPTTFKKDQVMRQLSGRPLTRMERAPSRKESVNRVRPEREPSSRPVRHVGREQVGPHKRMLPPRIPGKEYGVYPPPSDATLTESSTSEVSVGRRAGPPIAFPAKAEIVPRRIPSRDRSPSKRVPDPRRGLSRHREMRPSRVSRVSAGTTKADQEQEPEKKDGRLRRFKDKLAIIFHHHHHHHHHHHVGHADGDEATKDGGPHHHGSPWKYLGRILHHTNEEERGRLVTEAHAERAVDKAPARHPHGYVRELLDEVVRHVWRSRKRKAVPADRGRLGRPASRIRVKKLHWWQRFRRRGGVRLTNGKKPRLELGFTKTNPGTARIPDAE